MQSGESTAVSPKLLAVLVCVVAAVPAVLLFAGLRGSPAPSGPAVTATGPGTTAQARLPVRISGDVDGLAPGVTKEIEVTFANPNPVPVFVTELEVGISGDSTPPGCSTERNLALHQSTGISGDQPVEIPASGEVTVDSYPQAPRVSFLDTAVNQDSCKGVSFGLTYAASVHG